MEAESVGPETEKGGSRQEGKDEVAVGGRGRCSVVWTLVALYLILCL